jgi:uncharacterized protein (TIGR02453 family)
MDSKIILEFLIDLQFHNNRNWFKENDARYRAAKLEFESFIDELMPEVKKLDPTIDIVEGKKSIFRIYRDVRFSKNKEPYKTNMGGHICRGGRKSYFGGYYIHNEPDNSFIGGGVYMPFPSHLKAIRTEIFNNIDEYKKIIFSKEFVSTFGEVQGSKLKMAPKGYDKEFPDIDLLKFKDYTVMHKISNEDLLSSNFKERVLSVFKQQVKFNDFLNKAIEKVLSNTDD